MTDTKPVRADAARNRDRLLTEAAKAFAERGVDGSLEEIARAADVGIGTLYRHFPTRAALVEAVYRNNVTQISDLAEVLAATEAPDIALGEWLKSFAGYAATKRGMVDALKGAISTDELFAYSQQRLRAAIELLVGNAVKAGLVRADVDPWDLLKGVSGVCSMSAPADSVDQSNRIVDLLMDGMRYSA